MRIGLFGVGTRGDIEPLIALAKQLMQRRRDNVITLYVSSKHRRLVEKHEVSVTFIENDYLLTRRLTRRKRKKRKKKKKKKREDDSEREPTPELRERTPTPPPAEPPGAVEQLTRICKQLDLMIYTELLMDEMLTLSEYLRIPAVAILYCPNPAFPSAFWPHHNFSTSPTPLSFINGLSYYLYGSKYCRKTLKKTNTWRESLALDKYGSSLGFVGSSWLTCPPALAAWSEDVLPRPKDWGSNVMQCGFLSLVAPKFHHTPADMKRWLLEADGKILFVTLGSSRLDDPKEFWKRLLNALRELRDKKIYAIIQPNLKHPYQSDRSREEAGKVEQYIDNQLLGSLGDYVFLMKEEFPHSEIFPKVDAVLHHCGSGTTAAALRAGCAHLTMPIENDQHMWAARLKQLGVALSPIKQSIKCEKLKEKILSGVDKKKLLYKARALATKMADSNDGTDLACQQLKTLAKGYEFVDPQSNATAGSCAVFCAIPGIPCMLFFIWVSVCVVWLGLSIALADSESVDLPLPTCKANATHGEQCMPVEEDSRYPSRRQCDWDSDPDCPGFYELPAACKYPEPATCNAKDLMTNCSVNLLTACGGIVPNGTEWIQKSTKGVLKTHHTCNATAVLTKCNATLQEYEGWEENWVKATVLDCILHADEDICEPAELNEECLVVPPSGGKCSSSSCDEEEEVVEVEDEGGWDTVAQTTEPCDVPVVTHLAWCKAAKANATRVCKAAKAERAKIRKPLKSRDTTGGASKTKRMQAEIQAGIKTKAKKKDTAASKKKTSSTSKPSTSKASTAKSSTSKAASKSKSKKESPLSTSKSKPKPKKKKKK